MPTDSQIMKRSDFEDSSSESVDSTVTLDELDRLIRQWVKVILSNIDPPAGVWERIKRRAQRSWPIGNSFGS